MSPKLTRLGDVFTVSEALEVGASRRLLYAPRDSGELVALGGGVYRRFDAATADLDLIEIAERVPSATLCLETALARHDLLDVIPAATDIAIVRGSTRPRLRAAHRLHSFDAATFELGRDTIDVGARRPLGLYSAERSLIDMVRLRHDQGSDQTWEALRRWLARPRRNPAKLMEMASNFRGAKTALRIAFEVLL